MYIVQPHRSLVERVEYAHFLKMLRNETCCGWRVGTKCKFFYRRICLACFFGPSTGPEIILFRRLWESWTRFNYHLVQEERPILIPASESLKKCILQHCQKVYPRDDDRDFVNLVALMVRFDINVMHRARRIARFIYSMKIELLF